MNATIKKFGYPDTLLKEFTYWVVLLRPKQITLGSVVLACKEDAQSMSNVSEMAYKEFPKVTSWLETTLSRLYEYDKINYLALMMVDKEVHFHVIPRYSKSISRYGKIFEDRGWPKYPDLSYTNEISGQQFSEILSEIKKMV